MPGVLINVVAVLLGGGLGLLMGRRVPERLRDTVMQGLALCVLLVGAQSALGSGDVLALIVSLVLGGLIGEGVNIERRLEGLGARAEKLFHARNGSFTQGFMTASLVFCVGAMSIVGSLESGLVGEHSTLITKSALDAVGALFFAAAMGPGVLLSAAVVLLYQGGIALGASAVAPLLPEAVVKEMSAVGGLLIIGIGLNMLGATKIRLGNLLPAVFIPMAYVPFSAWIASLL